MCVSEKERERESVCMREREPEIDRKKKRVCVREKEVECTEREREGERSGESFPYATPLCCLCV